MAELTREEARAYAAHVILGAARGVTVEGEGRGIDLIREELKKIEAWLRKQALAGDRLAEKRVSKELGRQVRAPKKLERQIEALARRAKK